MRAVLATKLEARLKRLNYTLEKQKTFIYRVPDPDTRERAEGHLIELVEMRDEVQLARSVLHGEGTTD